MQLKNGIVYNITVTEDKDFLSRRRGFLSRRRGLVTEKVLLVVEDKVCFFLFIALRRMQNPIGG